MDTSSKLHKFYNHLREIHTLKQVEALLDWDQQVNLPALGGEARADQLECISKLIHQRTTNEELLNLCGELSSCLPELSQEDAVNIRETFRTLIRQRKLPESFIAAKSRAISKSYQAWSIAKPKGDFQSVKPFLGEIINLSIQETKLVGFDTHPYDALLDIYEPYGKYLEIKPLLLAVGDRISESIPQLESKYGSIPELHSHFPKEMQEALGRRIASDIGYSFESGRLDTAPHPFQTTLGPRDARITTRWDESNFFSSLYGIIHEVGHALYELGFKESWSGTPMAAPISLGIHESQSRFWENIIGRSKPFSIYLHTILKEISPNTADLLSPKELWSHANRIHRSFIRVEADEVTYSQHIIIRMLLEEQLIDGSLSVEDLPEAWNDLYEKYLGIRPQNDREGVLQDIHWYSGSIGYFPTYALGNLYGAMINEAMKKEVPNIDSLISSGTFAPILDWLRKNVHQHGMMFKGGELIKRITGKQLEADPFINYLTNKFEKGYLT